MLAVSATFMAGSMLTGCQSPAQKADNAQVKVEEAKQDLMDKEKAAAVATQKAATAEEWTAFKNESDTKIKENEVRIAELKAKMKKTGKAIDAVYEKSIDALEQKNMEMKNRMSAYEKNQSDWDSFKSEFNHDLEGLGQAFKDLTVNNKK